MHVGFCDDVFAEAHMRWFSLLISAFFGGHETVQARRSDAPNGREMSMSDKNFDEASYQIYEAVEQIQQANEAGKVATAVAAHHRDSRFKEAKSVAERELRWVDQQQSTLTAVQSRGRDTLGAVGIKFPAYTGQTADGTLTVTFREGLEMAVTDAQVAEKCLRAGVLDLEHLQSRQATIAGGVILAIVAIILLVLLVPQLDNFEGSGMLGAWKRFMS